MEEKFKEVLKSLMEEMVKEPECLYFNVFQDIREPNIFKLIEIWDADVLWIQNVWPRLQSLTIELY